MTKPKISRIIREYTSEHIKIENMKNARDISELLSLPRQTKVVPNKALLGIRTGLPINSLPGWEKTPLDSKLPMLKCPGKQEVIFTINKVGKSRLVNNKEFDTYKSTYMPMYNPLHDPNLRNFFSNEINLKRLRQNGEITEDNYVKCTLKDFNAYREELYKSLVYYVTNEFKRRKTEKNDRNQIAHAEAIRNRQIEKLKGPHSCRSHENVLARRDRLYAEKHERFVQIASVTAERIRNIETLAAHKSKMLEQRKKLNDLRIEAHIEKNQELQRKQMLNLLKLLHFKKLRFNKNMRHLHKLLLVKGQKEQLETWNRRLEERVAKQQRLNVLIQEMEKQNALNIEQHKKNCHQLWEHTKEDIRKRIYQNWLAKRPIRKKKTKLVPPKITIYQQLKSNFESLQDPLLCKALNILDLIEDSAPYSIATDPVHKAAQFILNYLLKDYRKDLSVDKCAMKIIKRRIKIFICDAKHYLMNQAQEVVAFMRDPKVMKLPIYPSISQMSFTGVANDPGDSSYKIHPFVDVCPCFQRRAAPSLESIAAPILISHLPREDTVFMEHYLIKFKRALLIRLDNNIFKAISCHFQNKRMELREELLELDKNFLYEQIAIGILGYAIEPLNFDSSLNLAISVLSTEIISELQQTLLSPVHNPCWMGYPGSCGPLEQEPYRLWEHARK